MKVVIPYIVFVFVPRVELPNVIKPVDVLYNEIASPTALPVIVFPIIVFVNVVFPLIVFVYPVMVLGEDELPILKLTIGTSYNETELVELRLLRVLVKV